MRYTKHDDSETRHTHQNRPIERDRISRRSHKKEERRSPPPSKAIGSISYSPCPCCFVPPPHAWAARSGDFGERDATPSLALSLRSFVDPPSAVNPLRAPPRHLGQSIGQDRWRSIGLQGWLWSVRRVRCPAPHALVALLPSQPERLPIPNAAAAPSLSPAVDAPKGCAIAPHRRTTLSSADWSTRTHVHVHPHSSRSQRAGRKDERQQQLLGQPQRALCQVQRQAQGGGGGGGRLVGECTESLSVLPAPALKPHNRSRQARGCGLRIRQNGKSNAHPTNPNPTTTTPQGAARAGGPTTTFTTPAAATRSSASAAIGSPGGLRTPASSSGAPKRMNLEKLKEAEEYRIRAQKMLKVG